MEKKQMRVVGMDCAEEEHAWVLLSEDGGVERRGAVENARGSLEETFAKLLMLISDEAELVVVLESRRSHGRIAADVAKDLGIGVWQVNTVALNHYRNLEGQPRKDDDWDAYLGARMVYLRMQGSRVVTEITDEELALSRLTRTYGRVKGDRTRHGLRLRSALLEIAPVMLHRSWDGPKPSSKAMIYLLERWPGFEGLERAHLSSIEAILRRCRYGKRAGEVAKNIRGAARGISIDRAERVAVTLELNVLVQQIKLCDALLKDLFKEIELRAGKHSIGEKLLEMDGIGPIVAGVLVSELLPVARTATEGQSATFSGVTPLSRKSGKTPDNPILARGVNNRVLNALYQSSVAAIKCSAIDRAYYDKKVRGYAGHPTPNIAAFIALSRQRHKVVFKLMTTNERYNKEALIKSHLERRAQVHEPAA